MAPICAVQQPLTIIEVQPLPIPHHSKGKDMLFDKQSILHQHQSQKFTLCIVTAWLDSGVSMA